MAGIVSVITPLIRDDGLSGACIENVRVQTYPAVEHLLVTDATAPGSTVLGKEFPEHVRVFHAPVGNVSAARNVGIERASGEYVFFLDVDQLLPPHGLQRLVEELDRCPESAFVYGHTRLLGVDPRLWDSAPTNPLSLLAADAWPATALVRRSVLNSEVRFDEALDDGYEFLDLWIRLIEGGCRGRLAADYLLACRSGVGTDSACGSVVARELGFRPSPPFDPFAVLTEKRLPPAWLLRSASEGLQDQSGGNPRNEHAERAASLRRMVHRMHGLAPIAMPADYKLDAESAFIDRTLDRHADQLDGLRNKHSTQFGCDRLLSVKRDVAPFLAVTTLEATAPGLSDDVLTGQTARDWRVVEPDAPTNAAWTLILVDERFDALETVALELASLTLATAGRYDFVRFETPGGRMEAVAIDSTLLARLDLTPDDASVAVRDWDWSKRIWNWSGARSRIGLYGESVPITTDAETAKAPAWDIASVPPASLAQKLSVNVAGELPGVLSDLDPETAAGLVRDVRLSTLDPLLPGPLPATRNALAPSVLMTIGDGSAESVDDEKLAQSLERFECGFARIDSEGSGPRRRRGIVERIPLAELCLDRSDRWKALRFLIWQRRPDWICWAGSVVDRRLLDEVAALMPATRIVHQDPCDRIGQGSEQPTNRGDLDEWIVATLGAGHERNEETNPAVPLPSPERRDRWLWECWWGRERALAAPLFLEALRRWPGFGSGTFLFEGAGIDTLRVARELSIEGIDLQSLGCFGAVCDHSAQSSVGTLPALSRAAALTTKADLVILWHEDDRPDPVDRARAYRRLGMTVVAIDAGWDTKEGPARIVLEPPEISAD